MPGESGLLFPVGGHDALAAYLTLLLEQPGTRAKLGRQARQRIELQGFSLEAMAERYARLYSGLVPAGG